MVLLLNFMEFNKLATIESVQKVSSALKEHRYEVLVVKTKEEALTYIKTLIPSGASVINGSSVTLEQIGYMDYLKSGEHKWNNLHAAIAGENDQTKRQALRKQAALADYYLGSVHALAENGEFVVASNTGSQLPQIVYTASNLIFVVSTKKIVANLSEALARLTEYVFPLESEHINKLYGGTNGTQLNKIVIFKGESSFSTRKIHFILVEEDLGF